MTGASLLEDIQQTRESIDASVAYGERLKTLDFLIRRLRSTIPRWYEVEEDQLLSNATPVRDEVAPFPGKRLHIHLGPRLVVSVVAWNTWYMTEEPNKDWLEVALLLDDRVYGEPAKVYSDQAVRQITDLIAALAQFVYAERP